MKKTFMVLVLLLVLIAAGWLYWKDKTTVSLNLLFPNGGEVLEKGSVYTIKWDSRNIPADDLVSISIRRLAPPPLPTEGQEFDPLIFFDLANTGQVEWLVDEMYPAGNYLLSIATYPTRPINDPIIDESDAIFQIVGASSNENWLTYRNETFGYSLNYPDNMTVREFPDTGTGAGFSLIDGENECITVAARETIEAEKDTPFEQYVTRAALIEIQDYQSLNSIEEIKTAQGLVAYRTTWVYNFLGRGEEVSRPISYFDGPGEIDGINYKTIQISLEDESCREIYDQMLPTFSFNN